jgi:hypothetical protein
MMHALSAHHPAQLVGGEVRWGHRKNAFDGFGTSDFRIQLTARLNYSMPLVAQQETDNGK